MGTSELNMEKASFIPQELLKGIKKIKNRLTIGIPKEDQKKEKRLALTPEAVDMITESGHQVVIEKGAGLGINYSDAAYSEAGAIIVPTAAEVFQGSSLIFKISPPSLKEIELAKNRSTICCMLQLPSFSSEILKAMAAKKLVGIGYELISNHQNNFPVRNSISEIEGAASISVASELLSNVHGGKGILMGGIPGVSPTEVVIIGAGIGGRTAARAALGLGATVKVFDNEICKLRETQEALGQTLFTSVFQPHVVANAFKSADVVIGAMRYIGAPVRHIISEEVVRSMKKGSLIIDLRINHGGCFETTCFIPEGEPEIFERHGVLHFCEPNLSSRVARTTSMALSNIFAPLIMHMGDVGGLVTLTKTDPGFRSGVFMYNGKLTNPYVANHFNLPSNDIGLFLANY